MKKDPTKSDSSQKRSTTKRESINALPSKDLKNQKVESQSKHADLATTNLAVEQENKLLKRELKEAAQTIAKYKELYHLAPIGYISLSKTGQIVEVNLTAAQLLNKEEIETKKFTLTNLILEDSKPVFNHFLWQIFTMNKKETCELRISTKENQIIDIRLTGLISPTQEQCLVTITDVTDQKRVESELHKWATLFQPKGN